MSSDGNVRFGSLADPFTNISLMSAFEGEAAIQARAFNVCTPSRPLNAATLREHYECLK